jgi:putative N6-adenine-specific DNA methylase
MSHTLVGLCAIGAEKVLGNELKHLGYVLEGAPGGNPITPGRVYFRCAAVDDERGGAGLYRANLCLRTADRVLLSVAAFDAPDFDALFEGVRSAPWPDLVKKDAKVVVDKVRVHHSALSAVHSVQSVVHKAIYTKLGDTWKVKRLGETGDTASIRVYIDNDRAEVFLDLSGEPLHKRGYRAAGGTAPIRETTAAVLLHLALWRRKTALVDPFCGSGTIPIEAALFAMDAAPGFGRAFAIESLPFFDPRAAKTVRAAAAAAIRTDVTFRVLGSDIDPGAVKRAEANAEHACVTVGRALQEIGSDAKVPRPGFVVGDAMESSSAGGVFRNGGADYFGEKNDGTLDGDGVDAGAETGLLLCNPPYGERLGDAAAAENLYRSMGTLFTSYPGWKIGVITSHTGFETAIGRRAAIAKALTAGNLGTVFYLF